MTRRSIHLIEDDGDVAAGLSFLLRAMGYQVKVYRSALEFLEELPTSSQGCVVTDVRMQGLNGIELTAQLRSLAFRLPVIMISAHDDGSLTNVACRVGAARFVAKPFDDEMLLEALEQVFANAPADARSPQMMNRSSFAGGSFLEIFRADRQELVSRSFRCKTFHHIKPTKRGATNDFGLLPAFSDSSHGDSTGWTSQDGARHTS